MNITAANHFLKLARRGRFAGGTGGELAAARLAKNLLATMKDFSRLDGEATEGLISLMYAANTGGYEPNALRNTRSVRLWRLQLQWRRA